MKKSRQNYDRNAARQQAEERAAQAAAELVALFQNPAALAGHLQEIAVRRISGAALVPQATWSWMNQILAAVAGTRDGRTFEAWRAVGRQVRRGSKAFYILEPVKVRKAVQEDDGSTRTAYITVGFRPSPRFRVEDTDVFDEALWQAASAREGQDATPATMPPLYEVAEALGLKVSWSAQASDAWGWFSPGRQEIRLFTQHPAVFFHELAHAADHKLHGLKGGQDPVQETVAEAAAAALCRIHGINHVPDARSYIAGYTGDPIKAVARCLARIEKVLALILGLAAEGAAAPGSSPAGDSAPAARTEAA